MNILITIGLVIILLLSHSFGRYLNKNHFYFINENDKSFFKYFMITAIGLVFFILFGIIIEIVIQLIKLLFYL